MDALRVPVAEADLRNLIERVAAGDQVVLTQDGEAVAELRPPVVPRHRSQEAEDAWRRLTEMRESLPPLPAGVSSLDIIRQLHEEREEAICPSISMRAPS